MRNDRHDSSGLALKRLEALVGREGHVSMNEPRYISEYDHHLGLYSWQVTPGERLLPVTQLRRRYPRVVAVGGGTGLPIVLKGLKEALCPPGWTWLAERDRERLTAVVTVADDGGSSGRLRRAYRTLPPGDIRNCLLALSDGDPTIATLFRFRFNGEGEIGGHSLGNLILTALNELARDFGKAVERGGKILAIRGQVFPATLEEVTLTAEFEDGSSAEGETRIASVRRPIRQLRLNPAAARAFPPAVMALGAADLIVIGPGSLYTSLISILLIKDIAEAIARSKARVILVVNLMTEPSETDGYTAADYLLAIRRHAPGVPIHNVLLNAAPIPGELIDCYAAEGAAPVPSDSQLLRALGCQPVERDLLGIGAQVRHDPHKLAGAILELAETL
jgi:uncharacterized cofD-like protein